jgi:hypothetical protein
MFYETAQQILRLLDVRGDDGCPQPGDPDRTGYHRLNERGLARARRRLDAQERAPLT